MTDQPASETPARTSAPNGSVRRLSIWVMSAYGVGDIAQAIKNQGFNILLLFYYQQIVGLPGTLTGLALGIALAFDAVTDPIVGGFSDRLKGRFGRRHPLIALAAVPLAIAFVLLFSPPDGMSDWLGFLWLTVFAIFVRGALTLYHIPHLALGAEMAHDYHQRSTLFAFNTVVGAIGGAVAAFVIYRFYFPTTEEFSPGLLNAAGYQAFAWSAAIAMVVALTICVVGTAREIPHLRDPEVTDRLSIGNLLRDMKAVFGDRDFVMVFAGSILVALIGSIEAVGQPFMGVHFWGLTTEQLSLVPLVALVAIPLASLLVARVTRAFDKKPTLIATGLVAILVPNLLIGARLLDLPWLPANGTSELLIVFLGSVFISASMLPFIAATYNSMYADLADAHELRTGKRREGAIYSTRAFANKATGALGLIIGGVILDFIAFPENARYGTVPADTIWSLGFFVGPATSLFTLIGVVFFFFYRITERSHAETTAALALRQGSADD